MNPKSKSDWQSDQREHEDRTDREVEESDEVKKDGEDASIAWREQREPSLSDTADDLNRTAEILRSDISDQHGDQAEKVDDSIETQRQEISEPAKTAEGEERAAADEFDVAASRNKRFGKIIAEASELRRDAESFLREIADTDEEYQRDSKETLDDHRRAVEQAVQAIRDL